MDEVHEYLRVLSLDAARIRTADLEVINEKGQQKIHCRLNEDDTPVIALLDEKANAKALTIP